MSSLNKVYSIAVDIKNVEGKYSSYAKFFDDDRDTSIIKIKLLNNNYPINLEGCTVEAEFILANNTYHDETCKIINTSEGIVELQLCQECLVAGKNTVRLSILKENEIANTPVITYEVKKGLYSDNPNFNDDPLTPVLSQMLLDVKVTKANQIELQERYEQSFPRIESKIKEVDEKIKEVNLAIASGTQDLEVKEARANKKGIVYAKLGDRLDEVDSQLEHIEKQNGIVLTNENSENDLTLKLQNLINEGVKKIYINGVFVIDNVSLNDNVEIFVNGSISSKSNAIFNLLDVSNVIIDGGIYYGDNATTTQELFVLNNANNCKINNITINEVLNKGISIKGSSENNKISKINIEGCNSSTGVGLSLFGKLIANNAFNDITCFNNRIGISVNGSCYNEFNNVNCSYNEVGVMVDGIETGAGDGGCFNTFTNITTNYNSSVSYSGIYIGNGSSNNKFANIVSNYNNGAGIRLSSVKEFNCKSNIFNNLSCLYNKMNGLTVTHSSNNIFTNLNVTNNTGRGLSLSSADSNEFSGGIFSCNTKEGLFLQGGYNMISGLNINNNDEGIELAFGGTSPTCNRITNCDIKDNTNKQIIIVGSGNIVSNTTGYINHKYGVASKYNEQTIAHGLSSIPTFISLTCSNAGHICSVLEVNDTVIKISLVDYNNNPITTEEKIYWECRC